MNSTSRHAFYYYLPGCLSPRIIHNLVHCVDIKAQNLSFFVLRIFPTESVSENYITLQGGELCILWCILLLPTKIYINTKIHNLLHCVDINAQNLSFSVLRVFRKCVRCFQLHNLVERWIPHLMMYFIIIYKHFYFHQNAQCCALCGYRGTESCFYRFTFFCKSVCRLHLHNLVERWILHFLTYFIIIYEHFHFHQNAQCCALCGYRGTESCFYRFMVFCKSVCRLHLHNLVERWILHFLTYFITIYEHFHFHQNAQCCALCGYRGTESCFYRFMVFCKSVSCIHLHNLVER